MQNFISETLSDVPGMKCSVSARAGVCLREHGAGRVASRTAMKPQPPTAWLKYLIRRSYILVHNMLLILNDDVIGHALVAVIRVNNSD